MTSNEAEFVDYCALSRSEILALANGSNEERRAASRPFSTVTPEQVQKIQPMPFWNHLICLLFLAIGCPNGVFTVPPLILVIGYFVVGNVKATLGVAALLLIPLVILPQPFVPSSQQSWMAVQCMKYFSFRFIMEHRLQDDKHPRILVAPPHGVFPYGNVLSVVGSPVLFGFTFFGLASSAALRLPIFKQILRSVGIIDASRHCVLEKLEQGHSIGISTGGVAEVFHTNAHDECILLKERKGMIKLAIRTGADLIPCYVFGNTKLLSCWAGEGLPQWTRDGIERLSRRLGFAIIVFYGRFGLPLPYRVPLLAITGKPVPTKHIQCDDPTAEQIDEVQAKLLVEVKNLFDKYKVVYGWQDKELIIQ